MKKTLLALLMASALVATGCGSKSGDSSKGTSSAQTTEQESSQIRPTTEEASSEETSTSETQSEQTSGESTSGTSSTSSEDVSTSDQSSEDSSSSEEGLKPAKLRIRFHVDAQSTEGTAYRKLIDAFNKEYAKYEIRVTADYVARTAGDSAYERQLATDMLDGTLPDVITFDAPNCAAYANTGYLYDISDYLTQAEKNKYTTLNTYQGRTYGVPIQESSAGFYYNKNNAWSLF